MNNQELIEAVENTNFCSLEATGTVLQVRFSFKNDSYTALIVPEGYQRQPDDPPVFSYREFLGMTKNTTKEMFEQLLIFKEVWPDAHATGVKIKTVAGGFHVAPRCNN